MKQESSETPPQEQLERDFTEESVKTELETESNKVKKVGKINNVVIRKLAKVLNLDDLKKLATKLGYTQNEVKI